MKEEAIFFFSFLCIIVITSLFAFPMMTKEKVWEVHITGERYFMCRNMILTLFDSAVGRIVDSDKTFILYIYTINFYLCDENVKNIRLFDVL